MYGTSLRSATFFTDLDELRIGDHFTVTVLDEKISYKVAAIHAVKLDSSKYLKVVKGRNFCILLTCTLYGINTKRLLNRGAGSKIRQRRPRMPSICRLKKLYTIV